MVGRANIAGDRYDHAVLWSNGTALDLGTLGGTDSYAYGLNNLGQAVGFSTIAGNTAGHATLWVGGTAIDLNSFLDANTVQAGWVLSYATGINDNGAIVGAAYNNQLHVQRAFVLAPVPEPETYAMMLAGLGMLGWLARRKKSV